jgi:hypothetical protein
MTTLDTVPADALLPLQQQILSMTPDRPAAYALGIYERVRFYKKSLADLEATCEEQLMEWIKVNGDLVISETARYYVGTPKTTKCLDVPATVEALMNAVAGDFTRFCDTLSANAIKHGAAKKILTEDDFARLFKTETREVLQEGKVKPVKQLMKADSQFTR